MRKKLAAFLISFAVLVNVSTTLSFAQQKQPAPDRERIVVEKSIERTPAPDMGAEIETVQGPEGPGPGTPRDFVFLSTEMSAGKLVKGAPYSAQAITESLQTLSDGNRIVNKTTAAVYRDSEGRTRREQSLRAIGAFANGSDLPQIIFINDPVAGTSYTLDPRTHVARKMPPMNFTFQFRTPAPSGDKVMPPPGAPLPGRLERIESGGKIEIERFVGGTPPPPGTNFVWGWGNHVSKPESLGKQIIEGVEAEGTRSTITIAAGEIGNERPIEIVDERWYSPELQTVVTTRHTDPRFGDASYWLTNIDRSEPARSLFEVPADYTLKSGGPMPDDNMGGIATSAEFRPAAAINGGVLNGRAITLPRPEYPPVARAARASGNVTVDITIDEDGNVTAARAVSGHPLLQAASVAAARNAKFTPTKLSGQAVKVKGVLVYTFKDTLPPTNQNN